MSTPVGREVASSQRRKKKVASDSSERARVVGFVAMRRALGENSSAPASLWTAVSCRSASRSVRSGPYRPISRRYFRTRPPRPWAHRSTIGSWKKTRALLRQGAHKPQRTGLQTYGLADWPVHASKEKAQAGGSARPG